MSFEHQELAPRIYLLKFENQEELASSFLRFQEHYESPYFKGKFFHLSEFKDWYIKNSPEGVKTGVFTYYSDWSGFNIPSKILKPFYEGEFDPLSEAEKSILSFFQDKDEEFYIIGADKTNKNLERTLTHEIAHGLFSINSSYRNEVIAVLSKYDTEPIKKVLRSTGGYNEDVLDDEVHAYGISGSRSLNLDIPHDMSQELIKIYQKYLG